MPVSVTVLSPLTHPPLSLSISVALALSVSLSLSVTLDLPVALFICDSGDSGDSSSLIL